MSYEIVEHDMKETPMFYINRYSGVSENLCVSCEESENTHSVLYRCTLLEKWV